MEFVYLALVEDNPHLQPLVEIDVSSIFNDGTILWSSLSDLENAVGDSKVFDEEAKEIVNALKQGYGSLLLYKCAKTPPITPLPPLPPPSWPFPLPIDIHIPLLPSPIFGFKLGKVADKIKWFS